MDTSLFIALRYLFAKKSHNVINVISGLSAAGIAIGTAAIILILSIYNGFDKIIRDNLSDLDPDILVRSISGKYFTADEVILDSLSTHPSIESISYTLQDKVFIVYGDKQAMATAKGVDRTFEQANPIASHINAGAFSLHKGDVEQVVVGAGLAYELGLNPRFLEKLHIYYPRGDSQVSQFRLASLASILSGVSLVPSATFSIGATVDKDLIILPIEALQSVLGLDDKISGIEFRCPIDISSSTREKLIDHIKQAFGDDYEVLDRYMQHPAIYKMMRYEKLAIFAILIFVVLIIAFNIYGSLTMLRIEKREDMTTLRALGANDNFIKRIFVLEAWLISLLGLLIGLLIGVGLAFGQQSFAWFKMPGGFFLDSYPVLLMTSDVLWTIIGVSVVSLIISLAMGRKAN